MKLSQVILQGSADSYSFINDEHAKTEFQDIAVPSRSLPVPGPCQSSKVSDNASSKSKQRRMRAKRSKSHMWSTLRDVCARTGNSPEKLPEAVEVEARDLETMSQCCEQDSENASASLLGETEGNGAMCSKEVVLPSCEQPSASSCLPEKTVKDGVETDASCARHVEHVSAEMVHVESEPAEKDSGCVYSKDMLEGLRSKPKADAVINLLLNRDCTLDNYRDTLANLHRYFQDDDARLASFLGMKFGMGWKSWGELESTVCSEVETNLQWEPGLTLGMVLAHFRRLKSESPDTDARVRHLTHKLNQPRRSKTKRKK